MSRGYSGEGMKNERLVIREKNSVALSSLGADVRLGLTSSPKFLFPKYFYDDLGSALFEAVTLLPEYYPTRKEIEILGEKASEIVGCLEGEIVLVELGSGSATKTRYLIDAILARQAALTYIPIEISRLALESSSEKLLKTYPNLKIEAHVGDYSQVLKAIEFDYSKTVLILFLGTSIGNVEVEESIELLRLIRRTLSAGDALLLGADLKKSTNVLEAAYDDNLGLTGAFNLNVLNHINRELRADFDIRSFKHVAFYDSDLGRIEMHLESTKDQTVIIRNLDLKVDFTEGERIHTENSYKYDAESLMNLASTTGFDLKHVWHDNHLYFSDNLLISKC